MIARMTTRMTTDNAMHIFLPLIELPHDRNAFRVGRALARTMGASLHVVANADVQVVLPQDLARRLSVPPEEVDAVSIESATGNLVDAVIRMVNASRQAMVILAVRFRDEVSRPRMQSIEAIGRQVLETVECPILVVPPDRDMSAWRLRKQLLPQDGAPGCAAALGQVIHQSSQLEVDNLVLRVAGAKVGQPTEPGSLAMPRYVDHPHYEWEAWGREFLDRICSMGANLNAARLRLLMAAGDPPAEILRVAREEAVDMIIMSWHCTLRSGRARMIKAVLDGAPCPVLLLPETRTGQCRADNSPPLP